MRGSSGTMPWTWVMALALVARSVMAGYLSLNMTSAVQCGTSVVQWWGDDGPFHLLLTPTAHTLHSYNVWLPSIPNGTNSYNLPINQTMGTNFLLTMWGSSGIYYAGTSDVMSVGPPAKVNDTSCFLTDAEILGLYSFSFNISDTSGGFPPQCSNMTMSWPTSLESNVSGSGSPDKRDASRLPERDSTGSSSTRLGNTTYPPSVFGLIPLGNSFSIPITYDYDSPFADSLPKSALSDNPTTWTDDGVTNLNWTIDMAKGTRFILVAGLGSEQQWASGGSSELLTVGQGSSGCVGAEQQGSGAPKVTATAWSSSSSASPTATEVANHYPPHSAPRMSAAQIAITVVVSVLGTLVFVGLFLFLRRFLRRRAEAARDGVNYPSGSFKSLSKKTSAMYEGGSDVPLDLISNHATATQTPETLTSFSGAAGDSFSPVASGSTSAPFDPRRAGLTLNMDHLDSPASYGPRDGPQTYSSPISPISRLNGAGRMSPERQGSQDALLPGSKNVATPPYAPSPIRTSLSTSYPPQAGPSLPRVGLRLHGDAPHSQAEENGDDEEQELEDDIPELKRDTLMAMGESSTLPNLLSPDPAHDNEASTLPARRPRRQRRDRTSDAEMEYVVHRDAGRVAGQNPPNRVMELPPRYEDFDWERERREDGDAEHVSRETQTR